MALTMSAGTVFAADTVRTTNATIDYSKTASLTLRKLKETNGDEKTAYGVDVAEDDAKTPMKGVQFGLVRIADIETVAGNVEKTPQVGTYYTNLDPDFLAVLTKLNAAPTATTITKSDNTTITAYTSEAMTNAIKKATANNTLTETGDEMINDYVRTKGANSLAETDADGYVTFSGQKLGLYVTAETSTQGYLENIQEEETNSLPSSAELISSPSDPFLVSLPQTNRVTLNDTSEAGSVWQYDVTAYPKNTTVQIRKAIRREGTKNLVETDDAEIGETVNEFITANLDSPLSGHTYETLKIDDAMNNLALRGINAIYMTDYVKDPSSTDQFGKHYLEFKEGEDYTLSYSTQGGRMNASDDADQGLGDTDDLTTKTAYNDRDITKPDDVPSSLPDDHAEDTAFQINFTEAGLRKINAWFASQKSTHSDKNGDNTVAGSVTTGLMPRQMIVVDFNATVTPALSDVSSDTANSERNAQINGENGITAADNEDRPGITVRFSNTSKSQYMPGNRIHVYTYRLDLTKDGVTDASQVSFTVVRKSDGKQVSFVKELDGQYHLLDSEGYKKEDGKADAEDAANAVTTIHPATGSSGKLIVRGLDSDTYTFTETTTQNGRSLLTDTFDVTLNGHKDDTNLSDVNGDLTEAYITAPSTEQKDDKGRQTGATDIDKQAGVASFTVNNYPTIDLKTGGAGQNILMLLGIGFAGLAGIVTVSKKQKKVKEEA